MWATTELYLAVQRLYRDRAEQDTAAMAAHLAKRLASIGREPQAISPKALRHFVKHAQSLRCTARACWLLTFPHHSLERAHVFPHLLEEPL